MMKKLLTLSLALVLALSLAACGAKPAEKPAESAGTSSSAETTDTLAILDSNYVEEEYAAVVAKDNADLLEQIDGAITELKEDGTLAAITAKYISGEDSGLTFQQDVADDAEELTMATNAEFPPYEFYDGEDIVGIDAEAAAAIADKLGKKLVINDMAFDAIIATVQTGKADFGMAGMTVTDERAEAINFTQGYATGVQAIIVPAEGAKLASVDDLYNEDVQAEGLKIGVALNFTGDIYATDDFSGVDTIEIQRFNKGADAVNALVTGKLDCVIIDKQPAEAFVATVNG